jgi:probable rRNA maturation factor
VGVSFHSEKLHFDLKQRTRHRNWIKNCIAYFGKDTGAISFIFTSNPYILSLNRKYLNHNYFTDVISFDYSKGSNISGDVFISVEQVRNNAELYQVPQDEEMRRVMIHGVLHLMGFNDTTKAQKDGMRKMENDALHLWLKVE